MKVKGFVCCNEGNFYFFEYSFESVVYCIDDLATVFDKNWRYTCKLCRQHFVNLVILVRINVSRVNVCGTHV